MASQIIPDERVKVLADRPARDGRYVLYWMQQSQRAEHNHALEYAVQEANALGLPLVVVFGLTDDWPDANLRHYVFMLEGFGEVQRALERRGIAFIAARGHPPKVALRWAEEAAVLVTDRGYLRHQKQWRTELAEQADIRVVQVEADVTVPVEVTSGKAEYAARTIRPKIHEHLDAFLVDLTTTPLENSDLSRSRADFDLDDPEATARELGVDPSVGPVSALYAGGTTQAKRTLRAFIDEKLMGYDENRNQPQTDFVSHMSKYLHFGQISPVYVARRVIESGAPQREKDAYIEELVVRRELAINFVEYTDGYDRFGCIPEWARQTLVEHASDPREHVYSEDELVAAETHDPYWNAAMVEMRDTGYMHNYMRMYWGKKILEWTDDPAEAFARTLRINNRFFVDGRDANSYAGVAWCYGMHDRAWQERPVFGKVRYMNANGLARKADPDAYVAKVEDLVDRLGHDREDDTGS
jgi:deoxyribodipyrimidine photo-lyase